MNNFDDIGVTQPAYGQTGSQPNQFGQTGSQPNQFGPSGMQDVGATQPAYGQTGMQPNQFGQSGMQDVGATQPAYGQTGSQPNQFGQSGMQDVGATQPAYGQTGMQGMGVTQPAYGQTGMQGMGATQPAYGQTGMQGMGATQPAYGQTGMQPNQFGQTGMQGMTGYQQPYGMQPSKPKKPLSKGAKIGIISGLAVALLVGIFFIFIFPILTRAKLGGSYSYKGSDYTDYYVFDDGIFVYYDINEGETTKNYYGIGTYTVKDDKVILTDINGDTEEFKFDKKENTISYYGTKYKSSDKKAKLDFNISKEYLEGLESKIITASQTSLADKDVWEEAMWWESYYIYGTDLKEPYTDFEEALAKNIGYSSDSTLQYLLENDILSFDVDISSSGTVTVEFY